MKKNLKNKSKRNKKGINKYKIMLTISLYINYLFIIYILGATGLLSKIFGYIITTI